jgi:hypothetical protein
MQKLGSVRLRHNRRASLSKLCVIQTCDNKAEARGLCPKCYAFARRLIEHDFETWESLEGRGLASPKTARLNKNEQIRDAVFKLHAEGIYPSIHTVGMRVGLTGGLCPSQRKARLKAMHELSIDPCQIGGRYGKEHEFRAKSS